MLQDLEAHSDDCEGKRDLVVAWNVAGEREGAWRTGPREWCRVRVLTRAKWQYFCILSNGTWSDTIVTFSFVIIIVVNTLNVVVERLC